MNLTLSPEGDLESDILGSLAHRGLTVRVSIVQGRHFDMTLTDCRHSGPGGLLAIFGKELDPITSEAFGKELRVFLEEIADLYVY